jgi:hypothetical protein
MRHRHGFSNDAPAHIGTYAPPANQTYCRIWTGELRRSNSGSFGMPPLDALRQYAVFLARRLTGPSLGSWLCPRLGRESISPRHVSTLPIWSVVQNSL